MLEKVFYTSVLVSDQADPGATFELILMRYRTPI